MGLVMMISDGEKWILAQNIQRFEKMLKDERDEAKLRILRELIEAERRQFQERND